MSLLQERIKKEEEISLYMGVNHDHIPESLRSTDERIYTMLENKYQMEEQERRRKMPAAVE